MSDVQHFAEIRIRMWSREETRLVDCTNQKSAEERLDMLKGIATERQEKACKKDGKRWTGKVTWIHIPRNDMKLCEASLRETILK